MKQQERDKVIVRSFMEGVPVHKLALVFRLSETRIYQILSMAEKGQHFEEVVNQVNLDAILLNLYCITYRLRLMLAPKEYK